MSKGFHAAIHGHVVQALAPVDINGSATNSDVWSMANHSHASILLMFGVTGATLTVTVEECDDFVPTNSTAINFEVYKEETDGGDTLGARVSATSSGFTTSGNDNIFYVIEVDASELSAGFPNLRVVLSDPSAQTFASIMVVLSGARYAKEQSATAIA